MASTADVEVLRSALTHDTSAGVWIVDETMHVVCSNGIADRVLHEGEGSLVGLHVREIFQGPVADERAELLSRVIRTGESIRVVGMLRGYWARTTFRRLNDPGAARALVVCQRLSECPVGEPQDDLFTYRARHDDLGPLASLTVREFEVMRLVGLGLSTSRIAGELHRSVKTVEGHLVSIRAKLRVKSRVKVASLAIGAGLTQMSADEIVVLARQGFHPGD